MFTVIIVVCSLKSMCIPSFISIGCCVSELHGPLCPYRNVLPEGGCLLLFYRNYIIYQIVYMLVCSELEVAITSPGFVTLHLL